VKATAGCYGRCCRMAGEQQQRDRLLPVRSAWRGEGGPDAAALLLQLLLHALAAERKAGEGDLVAVVEVRNLGLLRALNALERRRLRVQRRLAAQLAAAVRQRRQQREAARPLREGVELGKGGAGEGRRGRRHGQVMVEGG
jgi:hypothetical protein